MDSNAPGTLFEHFSPLEDGRDPTKVRHLLIEIVIIAIVAVICGADGWTEIEEFGKSNEEWFRKFLKLENGIPAHDTFGRVFSLIAPLAELDAIALGFPRAMRPFAGVKIEVDSADLSPQVGGVYQRTA
jgi:hypothetical protein